MLLLSICANVFIWELARRHQVPLALAAFVHVAVGLVLGLWLWSRQLRGVATPVDVLFGVTVAFLGPIGAAGAVLTSLLMTVYRRNSCSFMDWYKSLYPDVSQTQAKQMYELIRSKRDRSAGPTFIRPFTDVLAHGTCEQKQTVVALLARNYKPPLATALCMALGDCDPTIRIQAATAIGSIERRYIEKWIRLQGDVEKAPGDFSAHFDLACHMDDYAYTGILDDTRAADIRERARKAYLDCMGIDDTVQQVYFALGRLLLRSGDPAGASRYFAHVISMDTDACGESSVRVLGYYAECLYLLGRFTELRTVVATISSSAGSNLELPETLLSVAKFWNEDTSGVKTSGVG